MSLLVVHTWHLLSSQNESSQFSNKKKHLKKHLELYQKQEKV